LGVVFIAVAPGRPYRRRHGRQRAAICRQYDGPRDRLRVIVALDMTIGRADLGVPGEVNASSEEAA
jgi:hypothetical protein